MPPSKKTPKLIYVCQQCSAQSVRWSGRCAECGAWNSLVETAEETGPSAERAWSGPPSAPVSLTSLQNQATRRLVLGGNEFNRVLGGGIVPGALVLLGGDPGIGKSTLLLQVCAEIANQHGPVLYVSGEESADQIKLRAERLGISAERLLVLGETRLDDVLGQIEAAAPALVVVDSIQTVYLDSVTSAAGSVSQVRECAMALLRIAKSTGRPIFIIGHVTKEGSIAGPRMLEHIVDTVLYLEGDRFQSYRLLRAAKNRFGSTNEVGVFEMRGDGMAEVSNPSELFLEEQLPDADGSAIAITLEGTRPLLVELQALTSTTNFGLPRRSATGIDLNRLLLLTAVLTKRVGLGLSNQDIYVNVVGGFRIGEPAADLALAVAITSSFRERPVDPKLTMIGEIGLQGELRRVRDAERRLAEAARLGFQRCILPRNLARDRALQKLGIELVPADTIGEALARVWG
ncbi:MAG TPA: DNA repair protein RadA [Chloroflexota bacterium]|nr:DNA repair protein RadA [Chloroflexota bacterium]